MTTRIAITLGLFALGWFGGFAFGAVVAMLSRVKSLIRNEFKESES